MENQPINEADVATYLNAKRLQFAPQFPELSEFGAGMRISYDTDRKPCSLCGYLGDNYAVHFGATFDEAAADMRAKIGLPSDRAKANREQAAKLLAEAEWLEGGK